MHWIYKFRLVAFWSYFGLLTRELLMTNPWELFGEKIAAHPPMDTASEPASAFLHGSAFSVLAFLACFSFQSKPDSKKLRYALWLIAYSGFTEFLQTLIPNRWPSGEDVLYNVIGLLVGTLVFTFMKKVFPKIQVVPQRIESSSFISESIYNPKLLDAASV